VVVCASGGGGNFRGIIAGAGLGGYSVTKLVVDRDCGALEVAAENEVPFEIVKSVSGKLESACFLAAIPKTTRLIVLAGFMPILSGDIIDPWRGRVLNTHPSLLPKHGGIGMYGIRVQEAVLSAGDGWAGCTVHFADEVVDGGKIIDQRRIKVRTGESPWDLGGRVFQLEAPLLVETISRFATEGF